LIGGWLNDHEVVENTDDYQNEVFKVYETIAEMIERWDEYEIKTIGITPITYTKVR
jgi:hypothetical protein